MGIRAFMTLLFAAAIFGSSYMFIRIAAPAFGPVLLMDARMLLAGVVLLVFALMTGRHLSLGGRGVEWFLLAAVNFAIPFTILAWASLHVTASMAAIFIATVPLFTALVASVWMRERISHRKAAGLALGLVGVMILMGWSPLPLTLTTALALVALLAVPMFYAVGVVYVRQRFHHVPPIAVTTFMLLAAGLLLLPLIPFTWPTAPPPMSATLALLALALLCTSVAYLLFFNLIATIGPVSTMSAAYLIPVFGTFWGAVFLSEPITLTMLVAFAVILVSVTLVTGVQLRKPEVARAEA